MQASPPPHKQKCHCFKQECAFFQAEVLLFKRQCPFFLTFKLALKFHRIRLVHELLYHFPIVFFLFFFVKNFYKMLLLVTY